MNNTASKVLSDLKDGLRAVAELEAELEELQEEIAFNEAMMVLDAGYEDFNAGKNTRARDLAEAALFHKSESWLKQKAAERDLKLGIALAKVEVEVARRTQDLMALEAIKAKEA